MSNNPSEKLDPKSHPEEHKMNTLAKEFQTSLTFSQPRYTPMPYQNYYPSYPDFSYGYPSFNYPGMPYKFGLGPQTPAIYPTETQSFNQKKPRKAPMMNDRLDYTNYVPVEKPQSDSFAYDESLFANARFFIIKSYNEENVIQAVKYNIWSSTPAHNEGLNKVFLSGVPVILFFSVNGSGHFYGVAQMTSEVMFDKYFEGWSQKDKWRGVFEINWIFTKDIPNKEFKEIRNPLNLNKPVHNSRDCQEVLPEEGQKVMKIFENYQSGSSILSKIKG